MCNPHTTPNQHVTLTREQLAEFRTHICEQHKNGNCIYPDRCPDSHCQTWQRRNPYRFVYASIMCPNIEFVRKGNKMSLIGRCTRGRVCNYAHSKEEELYHPTMYKTKSCKAYPRCSRYYCPFAHAAEEMTESTQRVSSFSKNFELSSPHSQQSQFMTKPCFCQNKKFMDYSIQKSVMFVERKKLLPMVLRESPTSSSTAASSSATPNFVLFTSPKTEKDRLSDESVDENKKNSLILYSQIVVEEFEKKKYTDQLDNLDFWGEINVASLTNQSNITSPSSLKKNTDIDFVTENVKEEKLGNKNIFSSEKQYNTLTEASDTEQKQNRPTNNTMNNYLNLENIRKSLVTCSETTESKKSFDIDLIQDFEENGFPLYSLKNDTDTVGNAVLNNYYKTSNWNNFCSQLSGKIENEIHNQLCEKNNGSTNLPMNSETVDSHLKKYTNKSILVMSNNEMKLCNFEHIWEKTLSTENPSQNTESNFFSENLDPFNQPLEFSNSKFICEKTKRTNNGVALEYGGNVQNDAATSFVGATNESKYTPLCSNTRLNRKSENVLTFKSISGEKEVDNPLENNITSSHSFLNAISFKLKETHAMNFDEKNTSRSTLSYINALANLLVDSLTEFTYPFTPPAPPESLQTFPIVVSESFPLKNSLNTTGFRKLSINCSETESSFSSDVTKYCNWTDGLLQHQQYKCVVPDTFSFLSF